VGLEVVGRAVDGLIVVGFAVAGLPVLGGAAVGFRAGASVVVWVGLNVARVGLGVELCTGAGVVIGPGPVVVVAWL
jgi:hypothetical protein